MSAMRGFIIAAIITVLVAIAVIYFTRKSPEPAPPPPPPVSVTTGQNKASISTGASFDIVRVDVRGTAVIAGRADPGSSITLVANGSAIATTKASANGDWTIVLNEALPTGAVELSLRMQGSDGRIIRSDQVVVVSVPHKRNKRPLVVLGEPGGVSRVLQSPDDDKDRGPFYLETVDYDRAGGVIFSGHALPDSGIRVSAGGRLLGETRADAQGHWVLEGAAPLAPGRYNLQIDQIGADGHVNAIVVLPFERAKPEEIADAPPGSVIVQPGNSLWRIARRFYGSGWQFTVIYKANSGQIKDPDMIYPGQVFSLPGKTADDTGNNAG